MIGLPHKVAAGCADVRNELSTALCLDPRCWQCRAGQALPCTDVHCQEPTPDPFAILDVIRLEEMAAEGYGLHVTEQRMRWSRQPGWREARPGETPGQLGPELTGPSSIG